MVREPDAAEKSSLRNLFDSFGIGEIHNIKSWKWTERRGLLRRIDPANVNTIRAKRKELSREEKQALDEGLVLLAAEFEAAAPKDENTNLHLSAANAIGKMLREEEENILKDAFTIIPYHSAQFGDLFCVCAGRLTTAGQFNEECETKGEQGYKSIHENDMPCGDMGVAIYRIEKKTTLERWIGNASAAVQFPSMFPKRGDLSEDEMKKRYAEYEERKKEMRRLCEDERKKIIGLLATIGQDELEVAYIVQVEIPNKHQGSGIAQALVKRAIAEMLKRLQTRLIYSMVLAENPLGEGMRKIFADNHMTEFESSDREWNGMESKFTLHIMIVR